MRNILSIFLLFASMDCLAQQKQSVLTANKDQNTLLWEVSGNGLAKSSYLFGTFHLMCKDDIIFSSQLKTAVINADKVYLELDMDDPKMMLNGLMMMNMKNGKKLSDFYTAPEYAKLKGFFKDSLNMPFTFFESMKPFLLVAMLYPKMMPCKTVSGVEEELMKLAKLYKKEINGLETLQQQAAVFDSIPYKEQAKELLKSIDSMKANKKEFEKMLSVYKSQRLSAIEALFSKSEFGMQEHEDILLYNRNMNWVKQLKTIMKAESVFVAVGAGHLVGTKGLIALLKKEGYKVRPLLNK
jgi:uncharacterized protein YbaP (TraB family)